MTWTPPRFKPKYAEAERSHLGFVSVDSGTMCIASSFPAKDEWLPPSLRPCWTGPQWGASRTGMGDGEYDVLTLTRDGETVGIEIVFLCAELDGDDDCDDDIVSEAEDEGWSDEPALTAAARRADIRTRVQLADEMTAKSFGVIDAWGGLDVGDPCYGAPSRSVDLASGSYLLVIWSMPYGGSIARLAAYRIGD